MLLGRTCGGAALTRAAFAVALGSLCACGGSGGTAGNGSPAAVVTTPTPTPSTAPVSSSPTLPPPSPGPAVILVWAVTDSGGSTRLRTASPGGGPAHPVASIPSDDLLLGFGHGKAVVARHDHSLALIDLSGGRVTTYPGASGQALGAAFDDLGTHLAFVDAVDPGHIRLEELDLGAHAVRVVRPVGGTFMAPAAWSGSSLAGPLVVGFADAGPQGARRSSASSGAAEATTTASGAAAVVVARDALHAASTRHSPLGDDADAAPGPGPAGPFNTLQTFAIGAAPTTVLAEAHHTLTILGGTPDLGTILLADGAAAGGFAGISMSPDFGLFLLSGTHRTQIAHASHTSVAGALYQDAATAAVAQVDGGNARLVQVAAGAGEIVLDTVAGGASAQVAVVPAS